MEELFLTNTLSRKKEKFISNKPSEVGIYSCGPTVYWNQHIGHMYAYIQWDILVRFLRYIGYQVKWVVNITDVGHMTSDDDWGEDKMEKGAKREGISINDLAEKYTKQFNESLKLLNITEPDYLPRASEHIQEQINLAKKIEDNGFTYKTKMGLVYDTSKYPEYSKFADLKLDEQQKREDVEVDPDKKRPWDFFLWVTGNPKHIMQWDSPWGKGYPGWHLECTAMSTKYLGDNFDIHTGGIEHIPVHHTNEIAQGYAAFKKQTANYWLHNAHLLGGGGDKMSKSLGNFVTVQDLIKKGYNPLSLRYLFLSSHYRKGLSFSWKSLDSAQTAFSKLKEQISSLREPGSRKTLSDEKLMKIEKFRKRFVGVLADDLNVAQALAILWEMLKSNIPSEDKYDLALSFDEVLGLRLVEVLNIKIVVPQEIKELVNEREALRKEGKYEEADKVRKEIEVKRFTVKDTPKGPIVQPTNK